jgi:hypothetical protein
MRKQMKIALSLVAATMLVLPVVAEVKVDHEPDVDFESYKTYAWKPGTEAGRPQVQQWVVSAVERELKAAGLRKVQDRRADLYVVTHAYANMDTQMRGGYVHLDRYDVGVITSDVIATTTGVLVVDLIDGESERPVWRGMATEVMGLPELEKVHKKVDKLTRKMFKSFPPG